MRPIGFELLRQPFFLGHRSHVLDAIRHVHDEGNPADVTGASKRELQCQMPNPDLPLWFQQTQVKEIPDASTNEAPSNARSRRNEGPAGPGGIYHKERCAGAPESARQSARKSDKRLQRLR